MLSAEIALAALAVIVAINCAATVWLLRRELHGKNELRTQLLMIWLLPIVGAAFAYAAGTIARGNTIIPGNTIADSEAPALDSHTCDGGGAGDGG